MLGDWALPIERRGGACSGSFEDARVSKTSGSCRLRTGGGRTRRAVKVRGSVLGCPRYYSGLRGCGQTFTVERFYAEGRLVQCSYCGLFFPKDLR